MTREITHIKAFTLALESLGKPVFSIGTLPPTPGIVDQFFNDSVGIGDRGEPDARGPWNEGGSWEYVEAPAFQSLQSPQTGAREASKDTVANGAGRSGQRSSPEKEKKSTKRTAHQSK